MMLPITFAPPPCLALISSQPLSSIMEIELHPTVSLLPETFSTLVAPVELMAGAKITGLNQGWASDITYVQLQHEHIYLAVILDLYSRKCIGWELGRNIDTRLAMNALDRAIENRWSESTHGLVFHSDQGVQYAFYDYVDCLKEHRILISIFHKKKSIRLDK